MISLTQFTIKLVDFLRDDCNMIPDGVEHVEFKDGRLSLVIGRAIAFESIRKIEIEFDCTFDTVLPVNKHNGGASICLGFKKESL